MNAEARSQVHQTLLSRRHAIADDWHKAIARTSFVPLKAGEVRQHLVELTEEVIALLLTEPFDRGRVEAIGASLANFHYLEPEALGATQEVLARQLVEGLPAHRVVALQPRLAALLGRLATGFSQQARETILDEQDWIRGALMRELRRAQEALQKAHDELEMRVQERTAELAVTNKQLRAEITERKRMEKALQNAARQWHATFEAITDAVCLLDSGGRIQRCNEAMAKLLGKPFNEIVGHNCWEVVHGGSEPIKECPVVLVRETRCRETLVWQMGDQWFDVSADPLLDEAGDLIGAVHIMSNITERKRAEEALRRAHEELERRVEERTAELALANEQLRQEIAERKQAEESLKASEERYRSLFEGVPVGLYRTMPEGQILDSNLALVQMLGYPDKESLQAVNVPDLYVDPEERKRELSLLEREGAVRNLEIELRRRDGTMIWARDSVRTVRDADGRVQHYEGVLEDITERRQAEEHLMRRERLAAMGRLAATLAHEINNPLQAISNSLELALDFPLQEQERQEYLQAARREIERLMALTDRVLNFGRPPLVERKPIPVGDVVRHALALVSKELHNSDIRVSLNLPDVLPPVLASSSRLAQVFLNLIINAIEAMPDGGELSISAQLAGDQVEVTFTDSGPGIPPDVMARLFEPFYTTKENGTGLGLPTSYSIIQQHGGTITAGNAPGGGAVFTVALPIALSDKPHLAERSQ